MNLPIIMCVWQRGRKFANVIRQLNEQTFKEFDLYVWNNNIEKAREFEGIIKSAKFKTSIYNSPNNVGGFGRFYSARSIARRNDAPEYCAFIDDDQEFGEDAIGTLYSERAKKTIVSQYGWRFKSNYYFDRYRPEPGESVDYAGTGGMIADIDVFMEDALYGCPEQFWHVEDLWLSYFAREKMGYSLVRSAAEMTETEDEHSLSHTSTDTKIRMLDMLVRNMNYKISK